MMNECKAFRGELVSQGWRRFSLVLYLAIVTVLIAPGATMVLAQESATGSAAAPAAEQTADAPEQVVTTILRLFNTSPYINAGIVALSVIAMVIFLWMFMSLTSRGFISPRFLDNINRLLMNRQFDQAVNLCQNSTGVFCASIVQRVIENRDKDHASLIEILSAEGRRKAEPIWNRVNLLAEISNIAPMLGLLGTVIGMISVFQKLQTATDVGTSRMADLSGGISMALGTTMFGLIVAIFSGICYTVIRSRATAVLAETEQVCHAVADHTAQVAADPRLKKIDALAEAARQKIAQAAAGRSVAPAAAPATAAAPAPGIAPPPRPR